MVSHPAQPYRAIDCVEIERSLQIQEMAAANTVPASHKLTSYASYATTSRKHQVIITESIVKSITLIFTIITFLNLLL